MLPSKEEMLVLHIDDGGNNDGGSNGSEKFSDDARD